jgi:hypothetical protein
VSQHESVTFTLTDTVCCMRQNICIWWVSHCAVCHLGCFTINPEEPDLARDRHFLRCGKRPRDRRKACSECSRSKAKCDQKNPICMRCSLRGLQCVYARQPVMKRSAIQGEVTNDDTAILSNNLWSPWTDRSAGGAIGVLELGDVSLFNGLGPEPNWLMEHEVDPLGISGDPPLLRYGRSPFPLAEVIM